MNESTLKVVVADDDVQRVADWGLQISEMLQENKIAAEVDALEPRTFARAIRALSDRVQSAKEAKPATVDLASAFDSSKVLILDSDLTPDPGSDRGEDPDNAIDRYLVGKIGSEVARLSRAHSHAGTIVVVNEIDKARNFDLPMTRWDFAPADVYITHEDIASEGLWLGRTDGNYRPWSWPRLAFPLSLEAVDSELETPLRDALGLGADDSISMTFRQIEALLPDGRALEEATLDDVLASPMFGLGLQPKETAGPDLTRSVALRGLKRWAERLILPAQNVLIDLPHLAVARPWLLADLRGDASSLNTQIDLWDGSERLCAEGYNAQASVLLGRDVWNVNELPPPPHGERVRQDDLIFCEDISQFSLGDEAHAFSSDLEGSSPVRYIKKLSTVRYSPRRRLYE